MKQITKEIEKLGDTGKIETNMQLYRELELAIHDMGIF